MRVFNVTEAIIYLNELMPGIAPRNEETLRRAIRNGELKAETNLGREGNKINESDLIAYSKKYAAKAFIKNNKANTRFASMSMTPPSLMPEEDVTIADVLKKYLNKTDTSKDLFKIELLENKKKWEEKRNVILTKMQALENELSKCNSEINAFEDELKNL